jgi:hypothetical protein
MFDGGITVIQQAWILMRILVKVLVRILDSLDKVSQYHMYMIVGFSLEYSLDLSTLKAINKVSIFLLFH